MHAYALEAETKTLVIQLVFIHNLFNAVVYPFSGAMSSGLRAAGDVRFTTIVSIGATVISRLMLSYILGSVCGMGVIGIGWRCALTGWCRRCCSSGGCVLAGGSGSAWYDNITDAKIPETQLFRGLSYAVSGYEGCRIRYR